MSLRPSGPLAIEMRVRSVFKRLTAEYVKPAVSSRTVLLAIPFCLSPTVNIPVRVISLQSDLEATPKVILNMFSAGLPFRFYLYAPPLLSAKLCGAFGVGVLKDQNHMSRTLRSSRGNSSKLSKPSKCSTGRSSNAAGSLKRRFTAVRWRPSSLAAVRI